jgi:hypothetical protein
MADTTVTQVQVKSDASDSRKYYQATDDLNEKLRNIAANGGRIPESLRRSINGY